MGPARAVHHLGHVEVAGHAAQHVGVVAGEVLFGHQEGNHFAHRVLGGQGKVLVQAHADVGGGRFGAGQGEVQVLAHDKLQGARERSFQGRDIDFAVALAGVAIAHEKQRPRRVHRQIQRGAGYQFLIVKVAAVDARRRAVDAARCGRRGHAHAPEKRPQRHVDARQKMGHHFLRIERNNAHFGVAKILRNEAALGPEGIVSVGNSQINSLNAHFQHVARLGPLHENGAGKDVPARSFVGHVFGDVAQVGLDLRGGQARAFQSGRGGGDERVHPHRFAGFDAQHRRGGGIIIAPGSGGGRYGQLVRGGFLGAGAGWQAQQQQRSHRKKRKIIFHAGKFAPGARLSIRMPGR